MLRCKPKFLDYEGQPYYHKQVSEKGVDLDRENKSWFWTDTLDSCFLLPQWVVTVPEVRPDAGALTKLVKFLGTKFPHKSGLGLALEC